MMKLQRFIKFQFLVTNRQNISKYYKFSQYILFRHFKQYLNSFQGNYIKTTKYKIHRMQTTFSTLKLPSNRSKNQQITVYVRNYAKRAIMLTLKRQIQVQDIRRKVEERMKVPSEEQIFFFGGRAIDFSVSGEEVVTLFDRQIIHVIDQRRVGISQLHISVKKIQPNPLHFTFTVPSSLKVRDFVMEYLSLKLSDISNYFLVYTGRELNFEETFEREYVENGSQILCVHRINNLKNKIVHRDSCWKKNIFEDQELFSTFGNIQNRVNNLIKMKQEAHKRINLLKDNSEIIEERKKTEKIKNPEQIIEKKFQKLEEVVDPNIKAKQIESLNQYDENQPKKKGEQKISDSKREQYQDKESTFDEKLLMNYCKKSSIIEISRQKTFKSFQFIKIFLERTIFTPPPVFSCKQNEQALEIQIKQLKKVVKKEKEPQFESLFDPHNEDSDQEQNGYEIGSPIMLTPLTVVNQQEVVVQKLKNITQNLEKSSLENQLNQESNDDFEEIIKWDDSLLSGVYAIVPSKMSLTQQLEEKGSFIRIPQSQLYQKEEHLFENKNKSQLSPEHPKKQIKNGHTRQ